MSSESAKAVSFTRCTSALSVSSRQPACGKTGRPSAVFQRRQSLLIFIQPCLYGAVVARLPQRISQLKGDFPAQHAKPAGQVDRFRDTVETPDHVVKNRDVARGHQAQDQKGCAEFMLKTETPRALWTAVRLQ
ncbi:hypothetical protein [Ramlibacter sp. 2FC]|uniref:hypothetical protein n=1 Tax=Ramlibacter sp. 2FC TaxID=2502188 RepID=UPI001BB22D94|nr:hypothetical protein [Ramlibacter sp. 2FC]